EQGGKRPSWPLATYLPPTTWKWVAPMMNTPFGSAFSIVSPRSVKPSIVIGGQGGSPVSGSVPRLPVPTGSPFAQPVASITGSRAPTIVRLLLGTTGHSAQTPGGTRIVSPGLAASSVAWIEPCTMIGRASEGAAQSSSKAAIEIRRASGSRVRPVMGGSSDPILLPATERLQAAIFLICSGA